MRKRRGYKKATGTRAPVLTVAVPHARWSVDFVHNRLSQGRRFRIFYVIDDVTKDCLAALVDASVSGASCGSRTDGPNPVVRQGCLIVNDHGTEFTSNAMLALSEEMGEPFPFTMRLSYSWRQVQRAVGETGSASSYPAATHITSSTRGAPVASITSRSKPSAMPAASGISSSAARKSSSSG